MQFAKTAFRPQPSPSAEGERGAIPREPGRRLRVAYLLGTSYCGSTLLSFLAATHPRVTSVGEVSPNRKVRRRGTESFLCSCQRVIRECPFWTEIFRRVQADGLEMSGDNWSNAYTYVNPVVHRLLDGFSHRRVWRGVQRAAEAALIFPRLHLRRVNAVNVSFLRAALDVDDADVFFDACKGAGRLNRLLELEELDVLVIRVSRDVRAFVRSARKRGQGAAEAAQEWVSHQRASDQVLSRVPQDRIMHLRYEDLASDPTGEMNRLFVHMGVEPFDIPELVDPAKYHVIGNSMRLRGPFRVQLSERWRDELTESESRIALQVGGEYQERFGYC